MKIQKEKVIVYRLVATSDQRNMLDERILKVQEEKLESMENAISGGAANEENKRMMSSLFLDNM
jgi:predicted site-specific integrase-resolvase